jgi:hypothetical protein
VSPIFYFRLGVIVFGKSGALGDSVIWGNAVAQVRPHGGLHQPILPKHAGITVEAGMERRTTANQCPGNTSPIVRRNPYREEHTVRTFGEATGNVGIIREQPTRLRILRGESPRSANCL